MKLLLTGFGPFGDITENPSAVLVQNSGLPFQILEVSFDAVEAWLQSGEASEYDAILQLGVNARASQMHLERVGRNQIGRTEDVSGELRAGRISQDGPATIRSTIWPAKPIKIEGTRNSLSAGSYLCNYLLYRSLQTFPDKKVGFLHVPMFETITQQKQQVTLTQIIGRLSS